MWVWRERQERASDQEGVAWAKRLAKRVDEKDQVTIWLDKGTAAEGRTAQLLG